MMALFNWSPLDHGKARRNLSCVGFSVSRDGARIAYKALVERRRTMPDLHQDLRGGEDRPLAEADAAGSPGRGGH